MKKFSRYTQGKIDPGGCQCHLAVSMRVTDPHIAASMFSILMAVAKIGTGIGLALSGSLAGAFGFPPVFILLALLNLLVLLLLPRIFSSAPLLIKTASASPD